MLTPISNREKVFKAFVSKLTYEYDAEHSVYKDLGLTYLIYELCLKNFIPCPKFIYVI